MAHLKKALSRYATSDLGGTNQTNFYVYSTNSTKAEVLAGGYFNASRNIVKPGDVIHAVVDKDGTPSVVMILVATAPATGNVTVAEQLAA